MINILAYLIILLGSVFIFVSITVSKKFMLPNPKKVKILDKKQYIKSQRILFIPIGFGYILSGVLMKLNILSMSFFGPIISILSAFLPIFINKINRKYLRIL